MPADAAPPPARWLTAEQATARLGVSRQTLYAYVSRSRIGAAAAPDDPRRSLYDAADVRRLAERNRTGRSRRAVAASTISWGEPILVSAITRIEGGRLEYRGQDAIALAETATLEDSRRAAVAGGRAAAAIRVRHGLAAGACVRRASPSAASPRRRSWRWRAAGAGRVQSVLPDAMRILDRVAWAASGAAGATVAGLVAADA